MHKRHGRGQSSKSGAIFWRKHNIVWAIFYEWQGRYEAGEQAFREAAVVGVEAGNLIWHGRFLCILGEVETAVSQLQQALDLLEQTGLTTKEEQQETARALHYLGAISEKLALESLVIYERLGELPDVARGQSNLGIALHWVGKNEESKALLRKALLFFHNIGNHEWIVSTSLRLGVVQHILASLQLLIKLSQRH